ncbi:hypothetical protein ACFQ3Z_42750 [Streptomyces nogalater]
MTKRHLGGDADRWCALHDALVTTPAPCPSCSPRRGATSARRHAPSARAPQCPPHARPAP